MDNIRVATNLLDSPAHSGPGKFGRLLAKHIAPLGVDLLPSHTLMRGARAYLGSAIIPPNIVNFAKQNEIPIILRLDGVGEIFPYGTFNDDFSRVKYAHANADYVIYQSNFARQYVQRTTRFIPTRCGVILNGIEVSPPVIRAPEKTDRDFISICNNWTEFRYHIFKKAILDNFKTLKAQHPHLRWVIIGKNEKFKRLVGSVDGIEFVGFTEDLDKLRREAYGVIHLVGKDSCPNSLIESMSFSLPAIVWHESGGPEIALSGGVVLQNTEPKSVLNAFNTIEQNYQNMSLAAHKSIMSNCNILDVAVKYKKAILEALNEDDSTSGIYVQSP